MVFVDDLDQPVLGDHDATHLRRSRRLGDGAGLVLADGAGRWRTARLGRPCELTGPVRTEPVPASPVGIAPALAKGNRSDWAVQKLTELGVDLIWFHVAERAAVRPSADRAPAMRARWTRVAREAAAQSRRARLPTIWGPDPLASVTATGTTGPGGIPLAGALARSEIGAPPPSGEQWLVLIGPEGGWGAAEQASGVPPVGLGPHVLRTETAAVAAATLLVAHRHGLVGPPPSV